MGSCNSTAIFSSSFKLPITSNLPTTSSSVSSYTRAAPSIPPTVIIDENTSDVPSVSDNLINSFVPKIEDTCTDSGNYSMDSLIHNSSPVMNKNPSILNQRMPLSNANTTSMINNGQILNGSLPIISDISSSSAGTKFIPSYAPTMKSGGVDMNWVINPNANPAYAPEQSIMDNWLGQIFKSDNLTAGCSLPQTENSSFV